MSKRTKSAMALIFGGALALSGCAEQPSQPEYLLTAEEAGFAEQEPRDVEKGTVNECGPDISGLNAPGYFTYEQNFIGYRNEQGTSVGIGVLPVKNAFPHTIDDIRERFNEECLHPDDTAPPSRSWQMQELEGFGEESFAYQSVYWEALQDEAGNYPEVPDAPESDDGLSVTSTARVFGIHDGYLVRIQLDSKGLEPPSEAWLRELWDVQTEKLHMSVRDGVSIQPPWEE